MSKKDDERQRKAHEEYIELLKMKQGLIEESELIPETGYVEMPKLNAWGKFKNFVYHNKVFILLWGFLGALAVFLTVQLVTRKIYDVYVLVISTTAESELGWRYGDLEEALTQYCPDFDGNGYVKVGVNYIDLSSVETMTEYSAAQSMKFSSEMYTGDSQLYIADEGLWEYLYGADGIELELFEDMTEYFPEDELYNGVGLHLNATGLQKAARWDTCPDMINVFLRREYPYATGNQKDAEEQRERAQTLLRNILEGNVVNPPEEE
ncbi:MAG: hypothetical protein NC299_07245 [Lachnospiraceae bacterium]|nr:hypothetical protein [Ruminococcus sp.]MCM1275150.1 hypothetical protein [Lachnospiraceae bacterium]